MEEVDLLAFEKELYKEGITLIAGVDEVGRGPLCGPVVACACILPKNYSLEGLNDSKKLSEKKRDKLYEILIKQYDDQFYTLDDSVGYLMDGLEFLNCVRDKCITNNDGSMEFITVDGYNSNLGLFSNSFVDGKFLVTEDVFEEICKEYEVKVLWINK